MIRTRAHDAAIGALYVQWRGLVSRIAFGVLKDSGAAEDVTQEVFMAALTDCDLDGHPARATAWLKTVALRKAIDARRSHRGKGKARRGDTYDPAPPPDCRRGADGRSNGGRLAQAPHDRPGVRVFGVSHEPDPASVVEYMMDLAHQAPEARSPE